MYRSNPKVSLPTSPPSFKYSKRSSKESRPKLSISEIDLVFVTGVILPGICAHGMKSLLVELLDPLGRGHGIHLRTQKEVLVLQPPLLQLLPSRAQLQKMGYDLC